MGQLTNNDIAALRIAGKLFEHETVLTEGDLLIAVDVQTGVRRVIDTNGIMLEAKKTLLLG